MPLNTKFIRHVAVLVALAAGAACGTMADPIEDPGSSIGGGADISDFLEPPDVSEPPEPAATRTVSAAQIISNDKYTMVLTVGTHDIIGQAMSHNVAQEEIK